MTIRSNAIRTVPSSARTQASFTVDLNEGRLGWVRSVRAEPELGELAVARATAGWARVAAPPFAIHTTLAIETAN